MPSIDTFRGKLAGGGARANKFMVTMGFPAGLSGMPEDLSTTTSYLCSAATLPGMTIGEVTVPFRGRNLFIAGDRTFEAWTINEIGQIFGFSPNLDISTFFAGWVNRRNELLERLECRDCNNALKPKPINYNKIPWYSVPLFHCINEQCSIYKKEIPWEQQLNWGIPFCFHISGNVKIYHNLYPGINLWNG